MGTRLRSFFRALGPGFITGASDDDPSGIATYSQVGAQFGFGLLWTSLYNLPFMIAIQEMVARIGMVTGEGIAASLRKHYPRWIVMVFIVLIFIANTLNAGADLGAMADAARLLTPSVPFGAYLLGFTGLILVLEILIPYEKYASVLKWFAASLLTYLATLVIVTVDWQHLFAGLALPTLTMDKGMILGVIAIFGTTISPYLFVWQANEEVEEEIAAGRRTLRARRGVTAKELHTMRKDVATGMTLSQLITVAIIGTAAATFFRHGITDIQTASDAARALEPLAGRFASLLFAAGIIGTGLLAIPVLTASAAYVVSEAVGWKEGLGKTFAQARAFYLAIIVSTLLGLSMNFVGIDPIRALYWVAVVNGVITPPLLAIILLLANNKKLMKAHVNGWITNAITGVAIAGMTVATGLLFVL